MVEYALLVDHLEMWQCRVAFLVSSIEVSLK